MPINSLFIQVHIRHIMGLLYTKLYMDFDSAQWEQVSNDPVKFRARTDDVPLDIEDTSHKPYRLIFKKGGTVDVLRVTGKFRVTWSNDDATLQED